MNSLDKIESDLYNLEIDEKNNNLNYNFNNNFNHKLIYINNSNKICNITTESNNLCDCSIGIKCNKVYNNHNNNYLI